VCADADGLPSIFSQFPPLSILKQLADLRLRELGCNFTAGMLAGVETLTRLQLSASHHDIFTHGLLDPAVLAGMTLLQHLELKFPRLFQGPGGAQLLSQLHHQQQLTC
jgi:hypothetical protein